MGFVRREDYIGFLDNDDIIHLQMYATLADVAKLDGAGIIMCDSMMLPDRTEASIEFFANYETAPETIGKSLLMVGYLVIRE